MMARKNYPLNALRAFEASARHLSFVKAADELAVTPAAISHQVKKLEDYLDVPLFRRQPKGLLLTDTGQVLRTELKDIFSQLDRVINTVRENHALGPLKITLAPVFASKWLLPRLPDFSAANPEVEVQLSASLEVVDFHSGSFDAAIRFGRGRYSGLSADHLFDESVTPMCHPDLLRGEHPPTGIENLQYHVLLHNDSTAFDPSIPTWKDWLEQAGGADPATYRGLRFGQPDHAMQAAAAGSGIVLGWKNLASADLRAGRLVAPFDLELPLTYGFYFLYPEQYAKRGKIVAFRQWLLAQIHRQHER